MDILQQMKAASANKKGGPKDKKPYVFDEILFCIVAFASGMKPKAVSILTGRSVFSLRYKFLEGEVELDGKKQVRSVKKFASIQALYEKFGVAYVDADETKSRVEAYKQILLGRAKAKIDADAKAKADAEALKNAPTADAPEGDEQEESSEQSEDEQEEVA